MANLARSAQPVELDLARFKGRVPVEMMGRTPFPPIGDLPYLLTLAGHGFLWFRLAAGEDVPAWHEERLARDELPVLVLFDGWASLFRDRVVPWRIGMAEKVRAQLERDVLPLVRRRAPMVRGEGRAGAPRHARRPRRVESAASGRWLVALADVEREGGEGQTYFLPLTLVVGGRGRGARCARSRRSRSRRSAQQAQVGVLADAFGDETFCRALVAAIGAGERAQVDARHAALRADARLRAHRRRRVGSAADRQPRCAEQQHDRQAWANACSSRPTGALQAGINPEVEIGRFLTEVVRFPNSVPVAGTSITCSTTAG